MATPIRSDDGRFIETRNAIVDDLTKAFGQTEARIETACQRIRLKAHPTPIDNDRLEELMNLLKRVRASFSTLVAGEG